MLLGLPDLNNLIEKNAIHFKFFCSTPIKVVRTSNFKMNPDITKLVTFIFISKRL